MGHLYHGYVSHNHRVESSHVFAADDLLRLLEVVWDPGTRRVGGDLADTSVAARNRDMYARVH